MTKKTFMNDFKALEEKLNYQFKKQDALKEAFNHASYVNEQEGLRSYDRREFLGDAILDAIISDYLFKKYPQMNEGDLTVLRAKYVDEYALNKIGLYLDFDSLIKFRPQKYHKNEVSESMRADVVEAIFASIFLEAGYDRTKDLVLRLYEVVDREMVGAFEGKENYKSKLQEICQKNYHALTIQYEVYKVAGPTWDRTFYTYCKNKGKIIGKGKGASKKEASQMAAKDALESL